MLMKTDEVFDLNRLAACSSFNGSRGQVLKKS